METIIINETHVTPIEGGVMKSMTMAEALKLYWDVHASQKKSYKSFHSAIHHISKVLGNKLIHEITRIDIQLYRNTRERDVTANGTITKPTTVNREHTVLIHLFNLLKELNHNKTIDVKLPEENPAKLVKKVNERPFARKRVLTPTEYNHYESLLDDEAKNICRLAILTTLRKKDLQNLTRDNINVSTNQLEGVQAKTQKPYAIPITNQIKSVLDGKTSHKILNFKGFDYQFKQARKISGLQHFQFKDLRRSGARTMLMNGIDIKTVSEYLGHQDLRMTQAYVPPCSLDFLKAANILSKAYQLV